MKYDDLMQRIEICGKPNRELDAEIANALQLFHYRYSERHEKEYTYSTRYNQHADNAETRIVNPKGGGLLYSDPLPRFTGSIDDAIRIYPSLPRRIMPDPIWVCIDAMAMRTVLNQWPE